MTITIENIDLSNKEEVANIVRMLSGYLEEPKTEEPKRKRKPKAEEPKTEEPKAEEPKTEEPKTEEPKTEEQKVVETVDRAEVVALAKEIAGNGKRAEVKALINEYAPKLSEVPDDKLSELYGKLKAMQ